MVKIIFDVGSTHMRKREYAKEMIKVCSEAGADVVKFQLFPDIKEYTMDRGNVYLPYEWFTELFHYGRELKIDVTASVFDYYALNLLAKHNICFVKISYGKQKEVSWIEEMLSVGKNVVVTSDKLKVKDLCKIAEKKKGWEEMLVRLWCYTVQGVPEYAYSTDLNFKGLFGKEFQGFSDHSLNDVLAIKAVENGAQWIEKHVMMDRNDVTCTDERFALRGKEIEEFVQNVKKAG